MEIILQQDFKGLGYKNELVDVKPGYARNYLIPKGFALVATDANRKIAQENARQMAHKMAKRKQDAESLAKTLSQISIKIAAKAGEQGRLFGTITPLQLVDALKAETGYIADRRDVSFEKVIKTLGVHKAIIKLHKEVTLSLPFEVIAEHLSKGRSISWSSYLEKIHFRSAEKRFQDSLRGAYFKQNLFSSKVAMCRRKKKIETLPGGSSEPDPTKLQVEILEHLAQSINQHMEMKNILHVFEEARREVGAENGNDGERVSTLRHSVTAQRIHWEREDGHCVLPYVATSYLEIKVRPNLAHQ
eukprot:gene297-386_t